MSTTSLETFRRTDRPVDDISRRRFVIGAGATSLLTWRSSPAAGSAPGPSATRTITTPLGTYEIPANPQRVIAIDNRLDLEPAVALELPVIAYSLGEVNPWIPVDPEAIEIASPVNLEQIATLEPDLIVCVNVRDDYWLAPGLDDLAPVLPTDFEIAWRDNLQQIGEWLGRTDRLAELLGAYDEAVAGLQDRRGDVIADATIAVIQYDPSWGFAMQYTTQYLQPQVIADLGGRLLEPAADVAEDGSFSMENVDVLDGADAILFVAEPDATLPPDLTDSPLWQRLPAVEAGRVVVTEGNTNYGSVYTATKLVEYFDELYSLLA